MIFRINFFFFCTAFTKQNSNRPGVTAGDRSANQKCIDAMTVQQRNVKKQFWQPFLYRVLFFFFVLFTYLITRKRVLSGSLLGRRFCSRETVFVGEGDFSEGGRRCSWRRTGVGVVSTGLRATHSRVSRPDSAGLRGDPVSASRGGGFASRVGVARAAEGFSHTTWARNGRFHVSANRWAAGLNFVPGRERAIPTPEPPPPPPPPVLTAFNSGGLLFPTLPSASPRPCYGNSRCAVSPINLANRIPKEISDYDVSATSSLGTRGSSHRSLINNLFIRLLARGERASH